MDKWIAVILILIISIVKLLVTGICLAIGFRVGGILAAKGEAAYNKRIKRTEKQPSARGVPTNVAQATA